MIILAFLQNLWVRDPGRVRKMIAQHEASEEFRLILIRQLLFYGGLTGQRIKACFGDLLTHMIFEETTREIAGNAKTILQPDPEHIRACLERYKPRVVLTFGRIAEKAVRPHFIAWGCFNPRPDGSRLISLPHPAARQGDTIAKLQSAAEQLRKMINEEAA